MGGVGCGGFDIGNGAVVWFKKQRRNKSPSFYLPLHSPVTNLFSSYIAVLPNAVDINNTIVVYLQSVVIEFSPSNLK